MKLISFLSHAALVTVAAFFLGFAFEVQTLPLFGFAISSFLLLAVSRDYSSSSGSFNRWQSESQRALQRRRKYTLPYAA